MFSVKRFDPNQQQQESTAGQENFNPLSRLNQRLEAKNLITTTTTRTEEEEGEPTITAAASNNNIHADRLNPEERELTPDLDQPVTKKQKARLQLGFTGANTIPLPSLEPPKQKSSAKLKYLKRKKDRKKSRKRTSTTAESKKNVKQEERDLSSTHAQQDDTIPPIIDQPSTLTQDPEQEKVQESGQEQEQISDKPKRVKRPKNLDVALEKITKKKKRNREEAPAGPTEENKSKIDDEDEQNEDGDEAPGRSMVEQISQPGALPRFPAPTNPSLPDPQLLARLAMGLGDPINDPSSDPADSTSDLDMVQFDSGSTLPLSQISSRASSSSSSTTIEPSTQNFSLSDHSISRLKHLEFQNLLAVQIAVFSILIPPLNSHINTPASILYPNRRTPRDLCVSAPTGSGKTLSYIIPIVETLSSRVVCRLRALIVLPTRDLVLQVKNTFDSFSKGTGLKAAIITGQHSFIKEQALLGTTRDGLEGTVDILIATPGRLIDHLNHTPGFDLEHLCFLVLDEADQLLNKSQDWLHQVLSTTTTNNKQTSNNNIDPDTPQKPLDSSNSSKDSHLSNSDLNPLSTLKNLPIETYNPCRLRPFRILLFSATLRRDPVKLAHLGLRRPVFVKISSSASTSNRNNDSDPSTLDPNQVDFVDQLNGYCLPKTLKQYIVVTRTDLKPLVFFKIVESHRIEKALCFCKSIEGARRLTSLCRLMVDQFQSTSATNISLSRDGDLDGKSDVSTLGNHQPEPDFSKLFKVECFSSDLTPSQRKKILSKFQAGEINMLICSDIIARGIDIIGVENVINYDSPIDIKKYVHRVGRTARANEEGRAFSLVESQEAVFVKNFLKTGFGNLSAHQSLQKIRIDWLDLQSLLPSYNIALKKLGDLFGRSIDL
ncbi:hypothetical protein MJO29_007119 [Puccinia striiformis f. sp. tritici]|nr:hypothetical protein MJO29_007119 [Puccinia striiformis f. sp. tritici]